jgi:hypothetical protein
MTKKSLRQLEAVMSRPERADISWSDAKRLFASFGVRVRIGDAGRARLELNGVRAVIQTPSNEKESHKFIAIALERFFREARVELK